MAVRGASTQVGVHFLEACHGIRAELAQGCKHPVEALFFHVAVFGVEFIGVAYEFFQKGVRHVVAVGWEQFSQLGDVVGCQSGASVTLCNAGQWFRHTLFPQEVGAEAAVSQVWLRAMAAASVKNIPMS